MTTTSTAGRGRARRRGAWGLGALALAAFAAVPVRVDDETRTGTFHIVWQTRGTENALADVQYLLVDDAGRPTRLALDPADAAPFGGVLKLNGRRVTVRGDLSTAAAGRLRPALRVEALRAEEGVRLSVSGAPQLGSRAYVTILCRFADRAGVQPAPRSTYERWMGGSYPGLDHYWRELSEDRVNLAGTVVVGPYVLPQGAAGYVTGDQANLGLLVQHCTAAADAEVDFSHYVGINMQFNSDLGGFSWGGGWTLPLDGPSRRFAMTWMADWATQATYAHEIGHSLGLPHSSGPYDAVYDSRWDVMSGGGSHDEAVGTRVAAHTIAYHKDLLGWVPPERKYVAGAGALATLVLERGAGPPAGGYQMAQVPIPGSPSFYTVEARRYFGYDTFGRLPAEAVVIHRVSPNDSRPARVVDGDANGNPNDAGAQWLPGETFVDAAAGVRVRVVERTATGFRVEVSTQAGLAIQADSVRPGATMGAAYEDALVLDGAAGPVTWRFEGGTLPPGVSLAPTGRVSGVPGRAGTFRYTASVQSGGQFGVKSFRMEVAKPQLPAEGVMDQVLGAGAPLSADQARFLDLLGNSNGRLDVGDVRAWLIDQGLLTS